MTNIILCGGNGTRLWPISRKLLPKQFVKIFSDQSSLSKNKKSLFQLTVQRNSKLCNSQILVSNAEQYFLALDQFDEIENLVQYSSLDNKYLLEPIGRNTAPAIALACFALPEDEIVLVTPSDHLIKNETEYQKIVHRAEKLALKEFLVTFGIQPTYAETGYGYIEAEGEDVTVFHEKPDFKTATDYLKFGNYYWNSGMFCFKVSVFLEELKKYAPDIYEASKQAYDLSKKTSPIRVSFNDMIAIPEDSIDYALMEKSNKVKVIASEIDWSDMGSFDALYDELEQDDNGNTINENHIAIDSRNNLIYSNKRKVATVDVEDMLIVDTDDALLISKKGNSQKVKQIVEQIKNDKLLVNHTNFVANRPWGYYRILDHREGFKVKKITVKPGKRLSLQKHYYRSEHWIVISGSATVTRNSETFIVKENESTYLKIGDIHRLANNGKIDLVLVEVQVGKYTEEDDIVRLEDDFSRESNG